MPAHRHALSLSPFVGPPAAFSALSLSHFILLSAVLPRLAFEYLRSESW